MNFDASQKSIHDILNARKKYNIPRYQRVYSWTENDNKKFFKDLIECIVVNEEEVKATHYFIGSMLFVGSIDNNDDPNIEVVDGQQRLTTVAILLSAIIESACEELKQLEENINENTEIVSIYRTFIDDTRSYIVGRSEYGIEYPKIHSMTSTPFLQQLLESNTCEELEVDSIEPSSDEEVNVESAYKYYVGVLKKDSLNRLFFEQLGEDSNLVQDYLARLRVIKKQLLKFSSIAVTTQSKTYANDIFEILNAKGKKLEQIDLIKNRIFSKIRNEGTVDTYLNKWKEILDILYNDSGNVSIVTFYTHFWASYYPHKKENELYDQFTETLNHNEEEYKKFINNMQKSAKAYIDILYPHNSSKYNKRNYNWLVKSLYRQNNLLNVAQFRVAMLALLDAKEKNKISMKLLKKACFFIEHFHFVFNAICSKSANRISGKYTNLAMKVREVSSSGEMGGVLDENLFAPFNELLPSYTDFFKRFVLLTYSSKGNTARDRKCRYIIRKFYSITQQKADWVTPDDISVEHIMDESISSRHKHIGNLIPLEVEINNTIPPHSSLEEKLEKYSSSEFRAARSMSNFNYDYDETFFFFRACYMAELLYYEIVGGQIEDNFEMYLTYYLELNPDAIEENIRDKDYSEIKNLLRS